MRKVDWKRERGKVKWKAKKHPAQNRFRAGQGYYDYLNLIQKAAFIPLLQPLQYCLQPEHSF